MQKQCKNCKQIALELSENSMDGNKIHEKK